MSSVFIQMKLIKLLRYWVQLCPQVQIQSPSIRYNDTLIKRTSAFELWCWRGLLSPLDSKEIQPVHPKGNQSWILIGSADAETPILWPPDEKSRLIRKKPAAGKDWRREEKGQQRMRWLDGITNWWTWVWASSGSGSWTGRPGVLQTMGSQSVQHDWVTELNWKTFDEQW